MLCRQIELCLLCNNPAWTILKLNPVDRLRVRAKPWRSKWNLRCLSCWTCRICTIAKQLRTNSVDHYVPFSLPVRLTLCFHAMMIAFLRYHVHFKGPFNQATALVVVYAHWNRSRGWPAQCIARFCGCYQLSSREVTVCRTTLILVMIARYSLYSISCLSKAWKQFCEDHAAGHYDVASKSGEFLRKFLTATLPNDLQ